MTSYHNTEYLKRKCTQFINPISAAVSDPPSHDNTCPKGWHYKPKTMKCIPPDSSVHSAASAIDKKARPAILTKDGILENCPVACKVCDTDIDDKPACCATGTCKDNDDWNYVMPYGSFSGGNCKSIGDDTSGSMGLTPKMCPMGVDTLLEIDRALGGLALPGR